MAGITLANILISVGIIIAAVAVSLFIIMKFGRVIVRIALAVLINSILGMITLVLLVYFIGFSIPIDTPTLVATGIFGLPGVGVIAVLKLYGASLIVGA